MIAAIASRAPAILAALAAAALLLALALSPLADAHTHGAVCEHTRSRHRARSCASRSHRRGKTHAHSKSEHHRPSGGKASAGEGEESEEGESGEGGLGENGGGNAAGRGDARCEDASAPQPVEEGENGGEEAFVCEDGSEPACANGFAPLASGNGMQLLCAVATEDSSSD